MIHIKKQSLQKKTRQKLKSIKWKIENNINNRCKQNLVLEAYE